MLMKVIQINATCGSGSTGKICCSISEILSEKGIENYIFYTDGQSDYPLGKKYASYWYKKIQALKSRILGNNVPLFSGMKRMRKLKKKICL